MKRYMPFSGYLTATILLLTGLLWGCIKDSRSDCYNSYQLVVRTIESDSVRGGDLGEVVLFIFDQQQKFIGSMKTAINQVTALSYPSNDELYVIAWANIDGGNELLSDPIPGQIPGDIQLKLTMKDDRYAFSPDDLFQGAKAIDQKVRNTQPDVLWVKRKIANVTVVGRGLQGYLNTTDEDFTYVIRGSAGTLDLNGNLVGNEIHLQPDAIFNQNQEFRTSAFHVFPTAHLAVDVYKADQLVYTLDRDVAGNPIVAPEGKKLTIIIDFSDNIVVKISINDWVQTDVTGGQ